MVKSLAAVLSRFGLSLSQSGTEQGTIKFGEDFELDQRGGELRRARRALKLERIPMELLLLLIEHKDSIVSREQIVERIWGKDVYLDTDNSINGAIRKIRQALRDNPERPRYIQTVTGKGYRFIAVVAEVMPAPSPTATEAHSSTDSLTGRQSAGDIRTDLERMKRDTESGGVRPPCQRSRHSELRPARESGSFRQFYSPSLRLPRSAFIGIA